MADAPTRSPTLTNVGSSAPQSSDEGRSALASPPWPCAFRRAPRSGTLSPASLRRLQALHQRGHELGHEALIGGAIRRLAGELPVHGAL